MKLLSIIVAALLWTCPAQASMYYGVQAQSTTTTPDLTTKVLTPYNFPPPFAQVSAVGPNDIIVNPDETQQPFLGVGAALTDAAAYNLWQMSASARTALLTTMFAPSAGNFAFVRISFGSQDFRSFSTDYTYDDVPVGQTDPLLVNFSVARDTKYIIPILQQIISINPRVRVMASVWTPPGWMLASGTVGTAPEVFNDANYDVYAKYIIKSIQFYQTYSIPIWSVNAANEPVVPTWLQFSQSEETTFIGSYLGPQFVTAHIKTKILCFDDNWTTFNVAPTRITGILSSTNSNQYVDGVAWHAYGNAPEIMDVVHNQQPGFDQYMTEWRSLTTENLATDMSGMCAMICGSTRNWAKGIVLWNLALDQNGQANGFGPTSPSARRGVVTINNSTHAVTYNPEFYALYHLGGFVQPGAVHCSSTSLGQQYVAYTKYPNAVITTSFVNPDGSVVLFVYNGYGQTFTGGQVTTGSSITFQIIDKRTGQGFPVTMAPGELTTYTWGTSTQLSQAYTTAAPSAPVLTATAAAGENDLSWTVPSSTGPIAYYNILRGTTTGTESQLVQVPVGSTTYNDLLGASGTYYYQVQAVSAPGGVGLPSAEQSATATAVAVPGSPSAFTVTPFGANMALAWTASLTNGSTVTSYNILRGTSTGTETQYAVASQGYTTYSDTSATNGVQYFYKIAAVNATGTSSNSTEQSATVAVATPVLDATSSAFQATGATLTWTHVVGSLTHGGMIVAVGWNGTGSGVSVSSVTWNGSSLTKLATAEPGAGGTDRALQFWYILSPSAGSHSVVVTFSGSVSPSCCVATSFSNVNQATPFRTAVTATGLTTDAATNTITTTGGTASDLVIGMWHGRTTSSVTATGSSQTIAASNTAGGANYPTFISTQPGGTGSIVSSWAWTVQDNNGGIAVALPPG